MLLLSDFQDAAVEFGFVDVTPAPIFALLKTPDHGMIRGLEVRSRVLVGRRVAAADVAAGKAQSEMNPARPHFETILTAIRRWLHLSDLIEVRAFNRHETPRETV